MISIELINSKNIDVSLFIKPNTPRVKTCNTIMIVSNVFTVCALFPRSSFIFIVMLATVLPVMFISPPLSNAVDMT